MMPIFEGSTFHPGHVRARGERLEAHRSSHPLQIVAIVAKTVAKDDGTDTEV